MKAISLFMAVLIVVTAVGCASAQPSAEAANRMQMDELIALSKQGLSDDELIAQVEQRGVAFVLSPGNFDQQRSAGVSEGVLRYLQGRTSGQSRLSGIMPNARYQVSTYYGPSYLGYPYLGSYGGLHHYGMHHYEVRHYEVRHYGMHLGMHLGGHLGNHRVIHHGGQHGRHH